MKVFLFLHEASHIEKFKGTGLENGNNFFKSQSKNTQIQHFFVKNVLHFKSVKKHVYRNLFCQ